MTFQTEFEFTLPQGYVDEDGNLHKDGIMRLATAADEILPLKDPRVQSNPAYLSVILLSRVITKLGTLHSINTRNIENLFIADMAYLQELYQRINENGSDVIKTVCPKCEHMFDVEVNDQGKC
ncbi:phage tail assembly protein [Methanolobus sediminis]|uniref:Phage tail assembly protein n=1 Tax=Methanolobus sediminis TaxID=3072978 RepID=A0AA51YLN1_9EURY|nr:phage tail assembly protein [Methanolobus sediminis]WMW25092.1 phage tail assembly protein [Methanolobus sediminis]